MERVGVVHVGYAVAPPGEGFAFGHQRGVNADRRKIIIAVVTHRPRQIGQTRVQLRDERIFIRSPRPP